MPAASPVRRHARSALRRRQVLDAALACFAERGIDGTAIEDICTASGASVGSLYHQFDGKHGVVAALYLDTLADFQSAVLAGLAAAADARAGIHALVAAHVRWVERNPERARFLQHARHAGVVASRAPEIADLNREFGRTIAAWMATHVAAGRLRGSLVDLFIAQLLGPVQEYVRGRLSGREGTSPEAAIEALGAAAWRALGIDASDAATRQGAGRA